MIWKFKLLFCCLLTSSLSDAANILGVWPVASLSQYSLGAALFEELTANGHNITFLTPYGESGFRNNITFIRLDGFALIDALEIQEDTFATNLTRQLDRCNSTLNHPEIGKVLLSYHNFDLFIMDDLMNDCLLGIANYLQVPVIKYRCNNDQRTDIGASTHKKSFFEKLQSPFLKVFELFSYHCQYVPQQDAIYRNYFKELLPNAPALKDLINNVSLMFVNTHPLMREPTVFAPNEIEVGGLHMKQMLKDVEPYFIELMDKAKNVIYFSMGANLKSADMNPDTLDVILKVFASMESTLVLWKFETIQLKERHPKNVIIGPWMPQQEILAHKNLKVFITHGGFLSSMEAIYYGIPIVGIPITDAQKVNMERAVNQGYGINVDIFTMTQLSLKTAINAALNDKTYRNNATELSKLFKDTLVKPLDKAVYYVEHVLRTQGAHHLKTSLLKQHH
ncbi:unnamed protein product [Diamesa serratosioi]